MSSKFTRVFFAFHSTSQASYALTHKSGGVFNIQAEMNIGAKL